MNSPVAWTHAARYGGRSCRVYQFDPNQDLSRGLPARIACLVCGQRRPRRRQRAAAVLRTGTGMTLLEHTFAYPSIRDPHVRSTAARIGAYSPSTSLQPLHR
jgi:hypothetical protein